MASFRQQSGNWRAEIVRHGTRVSKSFRTQDEARAWAALTEDRLHQRRSHVEMLRAVGAVPPRLLDALSKAELDHDQLVARAVPCHGFCGVYFLIKDKKVVYVGQSTNVFGRIGQHRNTAVIDFDAYALVPCAKEELNELESRYIVALLPWHNKAL